ncbi:MAG TPA: hypothetical protein VJT67_13720 [Longimicrobiaceae bacterium]|nr:hypothetical protein [Longimicrobiaceae bacterium]
MERPRVYIETTIPSAYFDVRRDPAMAARRDATRRWWARAGETYELVASPVTVEELRAGPPDASALWLALIADSRILDFQPRVAEIVSAYVEHKLMPSADAEHLAFASLYACEYLLTWNFRHLANPNKSVHLQWMNRQLGLVVPRIVAPPALLRGKND